MMVTKVFPMPVEVIWCAEIIYAFLMGMVSWLYLKKGNWKEMQI